MTPNALRANVAASEAAGQQIPNPGFEPYDTYDSADGGAKNGPSQPAGMYGEGDPMLYEPIDKQPVYNIGNNSTAGGMRVDNGDVADAQLYTNTVPSGYGVENVVVDDGSGTLYAVATDMSQPPPEGYLECYGAEVSGPFQESDSEYYTNGNKPRPGFNTSSEPSDIEL